MKRILTLILSLTIFMTVLGTNASVVSAAEIETKSDSYYTVELGDLESGYLTEEQLAEQKNALTETLKIIIKNLIKHGSKAAKVIEKISGKKVAKWFLKYHSGIAASLGPLLEWSEIPKDSVADAIYRGVINAGGSAKAASNVATAIKTAWDLFLF